VARWALQRLFERGEGRFIAALASQVGYVLDVDDTRVHASGMRYEGREEIQALETTLPPALARLEKNLELPA
jgi:hypothetical protein